MAGVENRGWAILHLCVAYFGHDIDGEPQRSMVYKGTAIYWSRFFRRKRGESRSCAG